MRDAPAYYNEFDPAAAAWLRELIAAGLIPHGDVDERSIEDVKPGDLRGYRQHHFFAGIGGWAYALALAGWPADRSVWTGSCPCQPFSAAGKGAGFDDQRHLWPAWFHLIRECRPAAVFGEQVASKAAEPWIDLVHADLEGVGYAFGCVPFPAAGVGAPHIRDRNYWVAYASDNGLQGRLSGGAHAQRQAEHGSAGRMRADFRLGNTYSERTWRLGPAVRGAEAGESGRRCGDDACASGAVSGASPHHGFWAAADWLGCRDGKWRPVEPGTFPLAHGLPARVGRLCGYGNAIVPEAAAEFVIAAELARADMLDRALRAAA